MISLFGSKKPDHPMAGIKEARKILEELPTNDAFKCADELTHWLESVVGAEGFKAEYRAQLIQLLDETAQTHLRKLARDYMVSPRLAPVFVDRRPQTDLLVSRQARRDHVVARELAQVRLCRLVQELYQLGAIFRFEAFRGNDRLQPVRQFVRALEGIVGRQLLKDLPRLLDAGHGVIRFFASKQADHARLTEISGYPIMRQKVQKNQRSQPCLTLFNNPPSGKPARQLRAQIAYLRLELANAVDQRKSQRKRLRVEFEIGTQAARGLHRNHDFAAEGPIGFLRIVGHESAVVHKLAQFRFRQAGALFEIGNRKLVMRIQPHCISSLELHFWSPVRNVRAD